MYFPIMLTRAVHPATISSNTLHPHSNQTTVIDMALDMSLDVSLDMSLDISKYMLGDRIALNGEPQWFLTRLNPWHLL